MTKVKMKMTAEDHEKAAKGGGDFVTPKAGFYTAVLKECNHGYSKDKDGGEDKKRPRLECVYEIVGVGTEDAAVTENYGNLWDYVSFSEASGSKRSEWLKAIGAIAADSESTEASIDTDDYLGKKVLVRVKMEKGQKPGDEPRAKIARVNPWEDSDASEAFGSGDSDEDEADFGGEDEGEEEEETEGADNELLTEEDLKELSTKELGETAREFDIEPKEYAKKNKKTGKTKVDTAGLIAAILEAQGGNEDEDEDEEGEDGDDGDPF